MTIPSRTLFRGILPESNPIIGSILSGFAPGLFEVSGTHIHCRCAVISLS